MSKLPIRKFWRDHEGHFLDGITEKWYVLGVSFLTVLGVVVAALVSMVAYRWGLPPTAVMGVLAIVFLGAVLIPRISESLLLRLLAYVMFIGATGVGLGTIVAIPPFTLVGTLRVLAVPTIVVAILGIINVFSPKVLRRWNSWVISGLLVMFLGFTLPLLGSLVGMDIGGAFKTFDWILAGLFSGMAVFNLKLVSRTFPRNFKGMIASTILMFQLNGRD
jgi:hypothetical protein